jgi:hypothetical protein
VRAKAVVKPRAVPVGERAFLEAVLDYAAIRGWRRAHFRPCRTEKGWRTAVEAEGAGFPDLVLVREGRLIFAELKGGRGRLSPEQETWLVDLREVAYACPQVEAHVWWPSDWPTIEESLR